MKECEMQSKAVDYDYNEVKMKLMLRCRVWSSIRGMKTCEEEYCEEDLEDVGELFGEYGESRDRIWMKRKRSPQGSPVSCSQF